MYIRLHFKLFILTMYAALTILQDKLLFEPYSTPKHVMYLVVCPGGETTLDTLVNFFRNLSITYKVLLFHFQCCFDVIILQTSRLGCHVPLDKGEWDEGIVTGSTSKRNNDEKDEKTMNIKSKLFLLFVMYSTCMYLY